MNYSIELKKRSIPGVANSDSIPKVDNHLIVIGYYDEITYKGFSDWNEFKDIIKNSTNVDNDQMFFLQVNTESVLPKDIFLLVWLQIGSESSNAMSLEKLAERLYKNLTNKFSCLKVAPFITTSNSQLVFAISPNDRNIDGVFESDLKKLFEPLKESSWFDASDNIIHIYPALCFSPEEIQKVDNPLQNLKISDLTLSMEMKPTGDVRKAIEGIGKTVGRIKNWKYELGNYNLLVELNPITLKELSMLHSSDGFFAPSGPQKDETLWVGNECAAYFTHIYY